jgi:hypothetical protein
LQRHAISVAKRDIANVDRRPSVAEGDAFYPKHQRSEAVTTNDSWGNVNLPPANIEGSRREAASSAIDTIRRSRSAASLSFKSAAIGVAVN